MQNTEIIRAHYDAAGRGDLAGMIEGFAPDMRWTEAAGFPTAGTYTGPDEITENVFVRIGSMFAEFTVNMGELLDAGDTVIALGEYAGSPGETGRSFSARVAHVWRLADGKIVAFEQFVDSEMVYRALRP